MHESGVVEHAIAAAFATAAAAGWPDGPPTGLNVVIDPARVGEGAVVLHLELALRERGFPNLEIRIRSEPVACPSCGVGSADAWVLCDGCGAPLPVRGGPPVEARIVTAADDRSRTDREARA